MATPEPDQTHQTLWAPGPAQPSLSPGEIHIWRARLFEGDPSPGCPVAIEEGRLVESHCFRRDIAARYAGLADWDRNSQRLREIPGIRMALSECDGAALLVVSRAVREMGLDLERVREDIPFEEMAENFLDVRAQWDLRITWSRQEKAWKFFQFWTSNEACSQVRTFSSCTETRTFRLPAFSSSGDFIAALALNGGPSPEIRFWDWLC